MKKKNITLRDIAKMAKVSHMTVSRVINNDPKVRRENRKKILDIVKELNYRPDARARSFVSKKTKLIGLTVSDISNPFYAELARGIEDKAHELGYNVIFSSTNGKPNGLEDYVELMLAAGVDGLLFSSVRLNEPVVEKLIYERFPAVLINRKTNGKNFNYVVLNNTRGAYELTEHLINTGYSKIAIITGPSNLSTGIDRLRGYKQALRHYRIEFNDHYIFRGPFSRETGYEGAKKLLALDNRPEAIFAGNDYMAMGVFNALGEMGLRIPDDIAVVGFDDTEFASDRRIQLTTVSQRKYEMGNLGVQILIDYIERGETDYTHKVVLEPQLIIRESCGAKKRGKQNPI